MSSTVYLLFEIGKSIPIHELVSIIKEMCNNFGINYTKSIQKFDEFGKVKYDSFCINDKPLTTKSECYKRSVCLNIYDEPYENRLEEFEWDQSGNKYYAAIDFEYFVDNEDLFLKIIYPLLKIYPQAKFWCENKWFYTSEDLEKIINRPYDENWCYKDPKNL